MSVLKDIADALAASLAAETFSSTPSAVSVDRKNWPTYDVEDLANPVIAVTPSTVETVRADRLQWQYDYGLNVFIGRHAPTEEAADEMIELAEEVLDLIRDHDWDAETWPEGVTSPMTCEIDLNPDEALQERNVWRAVVTVVYRVHR